MTIIATAFTENFRYIITDAIVSTAYNHNMVKNKIDLIEPNVYMALLGDELLLEAVRWLINWANIKNRKINYRSKEDIERIITIEKYIRIAHLSNTPRLPNLPPIFEGQVARLIFMDTNDLFYWTLSYDKSFGVYKIYTESPSKFEKNKLYIFYGGLEPAIINSIDLNEGNVIDKIWTEINKLHESHKGTDNYLGYDLQNMKSSIIASNETKLFTHTVPFTNFTEYLYGSYIGSNIEMLRKNDKWDPFQ